MTAGVDLELRGEDGRRRAPGPGMPANLVGLLVRDGSRWCPLPPLDELPGSPRPGGVLAGADLDLWIELLGAPLPRGGIGICFRGGEAVTGSIDPDALATGAVRLDVTMRYEAYLAYRIGELGVSEALAGRPRAPWPLLMLAAGLLDGPEQCDARSSRSASPTILQTWARVVRRAAAGG